jgi:hypothetical protein
MIENSIHLGRYEASKSKQHPVGMTVQWKPEHSDYNGNPNLFASNAEWVLLDRNL